MLDSVWKWKASPPWIVLGFLSSCVVVALAVGILLFFSVSKHSVYA